MNTRWYSLRRRLLGSLLGGLAVLWLGIALTSYVDAHHEIDELFDAQMTQVAHALLAIARHEAHEDEQIEEMTERQHRYGRHFQFQVWRDGETLLMRSGNVSSDLLTRKEGFSDVEDAAGRWRLFCLTVPDGSLRVIVAEHHHGRDELVQHIALRLLLPALIGLPLIGLWIWGTTRRALKPLDAAATDIAGRDPAQLVPISPADAPIEIRPMLESINRLFERVETALATERRLTADAAHEMRTPIAALLTQVQVAEHARTDGERQQSLQQIRIGLVRTSRLVDQMLQLARLDPESSLPAPCAVDLAQTAETVCAELGTMILEREIDFAFINPGPARVMGQPEWLHVLIRNLLDNAVRYTPSGGRIRVIVEKGDAGYCLRVIDSGPGIPVADRARVCQRFYRQPGNQVAGNGLGLAIVDRIAALHHADFRLVDTETGQGIEARVCFRQL